MKIYYDMNEILQNYFLKTIFDQLVGKEESLEQKEIFKICF